MSALSPASWRALHIGGMAAVALFAVLTAYYTKSKFAWVTAAVAVLVAVIAGLDLWQRELGERRTT